MPLPELAALGPAYDAWNVGDVGWVRVASFSAAYVAHHPLQIARNGMPQEIGRTMVGHKLAKARFHPPYNCVRSERMP